jgi:hypothetical protein
MQGKKSAENSEIACAGQGDGQGDTPLLEKKSSWHEPEDFFLTCQGSLIRQDQTTD